MKCMSTRDASLVTSFHDALFHGFAPDGGLYIPNKLPCLPNPILKHIHEYSLTELGQIIVTTFIDEITPPDMQRIINNTLTFSIPLVPLIDDLYLLEVFHGPTFSFKDIGARFMANVVAHILANEKKHLSVLVATSGDTGSAIAHAFHHIPNVNVYVLYPSNKITFLQEQQMTTLGGNVHAVEVMGTFDDCQQLVRSAVLDKDLRANRLVTTANSINISRLLPQIIYHSWGICQLKQLGIKKDPILAVPSGNFGNLVSALYAKSLGIPVQHFIAATNINTTVPRYLETSEFLPEPSKHTLANAMDVGNPSNFERLQAYFDHDLQKMRQAITAVSAKDDSILTEISRTYAQTGYILDPHTAVGVVAARQTPNRPIIVTATAHPAKFPEVIQQAIGKQAEAPEYLQEVLKHQKQSQKISPQYTDLKRILL